MLGFTLYVLAQILPGPRDVSPQSYISKALLATSNPPVILQKIVIGNGLFYDVSQSTNIATVSIRKSTVLSQLQPMPPWQTSIIGSFPQLINFDEGVFDAFRSKCVYPLAGSLNLLKRVTGLIFVAMMLTWHIRNSHPYHTLNQQIGRASCRERVSPYV